MRNINFKRLELSIRRLISFLPRSHHVLKINKMFMNLNKDVQVHFSRCIHLSSVKNDFYKFVNKPKDVEKTKDALSHTHLKEILKDCHSYPEQLLTFHSYVELSAEDISKRIATCQEIKELLRPHFPSCSLHPIGSTVTGLGMKGCDMDLSFQTNDNESSKNSAEETENIFLTNDVVDGKIPSSAFSSLNPKQKLHFLNKILKETGVVGTVIPGRFPILSIKYNGIAVDLGVNNLPGLSTTNFMSLCTNLDPRVAPLHRFFTYWARNRRLCGGPLKFKSYALFLLVVFFLQTRQPRILPPIEHMLDRADFHRNLGNWSYDISKHIHKLEKSENVQSLDELLREFFFFYANFDFSYVICTTKCELVKGWDFMSERKHDFEMNAISIQDPFNLSLNVTGGVSNKYCTLFTRELLSTCEVYQDSGSWQPSPDNPWGYLALFEKHHLFKDTQNKKFVTFQVPFGTDTYDEVAKKVIEVFRYCLDFKCKVVNENEYLLLKLNKPVIEQDLKSSSAHDDQGSLVSRFLCTACRMQKTWFGRSNFVLQPEATDTGNYVLRLGSTHERNFELKDRSNLKLQSEVELESNCEQSKNEMEDKCNFQQQTETIDCELHVTATDSCDTRLRVGIKNCFLESEREISKKLSALREGSEKGEFSFICEFRSKGDFLHVTLEPISSDEFIPKLAVFLVQYIPKCIKKQLCNK